MKTTIILALGAAAGLLLCLWAAARMVIRAGFRWAARRIPEQGNVAALTLTRSEVTDSYPALRRDFTARLPFRPLRWLAGKALDLKAGQIMEGITGFMDRHQTDSISGHQLHQWFTEWGADRAAGIVVGFVSSLCIKIFLILLFVAASAWALVAD